VTFVFFAAGQSGLGRAEGETAPADKAAKPAPAAKATKATKATTKGEMTLKGEMMCGKCALNETPACQNVLEVGEGSKKTRYYLADNKVAQDNHEQVCSGTAKATVVGKVKKAKGKNVVTASAITYE